MVKSRKMESRGKWKVEEKESRKKRSRKMESRGKKVEEVKVEEKKVEEKILYWDKVRMS